MSLPSGRNAKVSGSVYLARRLRRDDTMRTNYIIIASACFLLPVYAAAAGPLGIFEDHTDVGTILHAGSVEYDASKQTYTLAGSGDNMWFAADAFQFVWKKVSGDVTLTADISFIGSGGEGHRKAVLMVRQSLDADSTYADVARHGDGLTSLQARDEKGANTTEIQSAIQSPARVRIAKQGDYFYIWVAGAGEDLQFSGGSMRVPMHDPIYVGIGVCSHNKDVVEKAVFSNVNLMIGRNDVAPRLYSTLETVPLSGDRRVVYVTQGRLSSPVWTSDGSAIVFHSDSGMKKIATAGGKPEDVEQFELAPSPLRLTCRQTVSGTTIRSARRTGSKSHFCLWLSTRLLSPWTRTLCCASCRSKAATCECWRNSSEERAPWMRPTGRRTAAA